MDKKLRWRWNRAACLAGACGSEFIDDPERVFEHIKTMERMTVKMAYKKGQLGLPLNLDEGKDRQ